MKKIFGGLNITWKVLIISSIIIGVLVGLINSIPFFKNTSFTDPAVYFDLWIFFGILIIMNAKSNKEAALKSFIFFLISQPLIYLVEVPFSRLGWQLFIYYKYWFIWTIFCLPMGYVGYYLKKDKWWCLLILLPIMFILANDVTVHLSGLVYSFPKHLLSYLFCIASLIIYPLSLLKNKKAKIIGLIIGILSIIGFSLMTILNKPVYETDILCSGMNYDLNENYKVSIQDNEYGSVSLKYIESIDSYCIHAKFKKEGKTTLTLEDSSGNKQLFDLDIKMNTYTITEKTVN